MNISENCPKSESEKEKKLPSPNRNHSSPAISVTHNVSSTVSETTTSSNIYNFKSTAQPTFSSSIMFPANKVAEITSNLDVSGELSVSYRENS